MSPTKPTNATKPTKQHTNKTTKRTLLSLASLLQSYLLGSYLGSLTFVVLLFSAPDSLPPSDRLMTDDEAFTSLTSVSMEIPYVDEGVWPKSCSNVKVSFGLVRKDSALPVPQTV